jgi:hypothetical protein
MPHRPLHSNYADALEKFGIDGEQARAWLELQIKGIRSLISEIEAHPRFGDV